MKRFSNKELCIISNGLLALIRDAGEAKKLVNRKESHNMIDQEINELVTLNQKICDMMAG